jgi:hypothetical protein
VLGHLGSAPRVNDGAARVRLLMGGLSVSHAAWDADPVHGVNAMHSVTKLGTARGRPRGVAFDCANRWAASELEMVHAALRQPAPCREHRRARVAVAVSAAAR